MSMTPPPPPPPPPPPSVPPAGPSVYVPAAAKPSNYLAWAIFVTFCCCTPLGIPAIVYAARVDSMWAAGRFDDAHTASKKAKTWVTVSVVAGLIGVLVSVAFELAGSGVAP